MEIASYAAECARFSPSQRGKEFVDIFGDFPIEMGDLSQYGYSLSQEDIDREVWRSVAGRRSERYAERLKEQFETLVDLVPATASLREYLRNTTLFAMSFGLTPGEGLKSHLAWWGQKNMFDEASAKALDIETYIKHLGFGLAVQKGEECAPFYGQFPKICPSMVYMVSVWGVELTDKHPELVGHLPLI